MSPDRDVLLRHWRKQGFEYGFKGRLREMNLRQLPTASLAGNHEYCLRRLIVEAQCSFVRFFKPRSV